MTNKEDNIELRSEEFQEVLGSVPSWILRWGIVLIGVIIGIILIGSSIFKYPDTISSVMTLTGTTPPASIVAKFSGRLKELCVGDKDSIKTGHRLAVIENSAKTSDV
jgi:HlyD family secretion protein